MWDNGGQSFLVTPGFWLSAASQVCCGSQAPATHTIRIVTQIQFVVVSTQERAKRTRQQKPKQKKSDKGTHPSDEGAALMDREGPPFPVADLSSGPQGLGLCRVQGRACIVRTQRSPEGG